MKRKAKENKFKDIREFFSSSKKEFKRTRENLYSKENVENNRVNTVVESLVDLIFKTSEENFEKNKKPKLETSKQEKNAPSRFTNCEKCGVSISIFDEIFHQTFDCPPKPKPKIQMKAKPEVTSNSSAIPQKSEQAKDSRVNMNLKAGSLEDSELLPFVSSPKDSKTLIIEWAIEVPGLGIVQNFLTPEQENEIIEELYKIEWEDSPSFSGSRKQQRFGPHVDFVNNIVGSKKELPFLRYSERLVKQMQEQIPFLENFQPNSQLNNWYRKDLGDSIYFHTDHRGLFADIIISIAVAGDCNILLQSIRNTNEVIAMAFPRRSLVIMSGDARYTWKHSIPNSELLSPNRISITYRTLKPEFLQETNND